MLEVLSPAGSYEGVAAAVQNGADAVVLSMSDTDALKNANGFSQDEFGMALEYCRVRGVRTYLGLSTLAIDGELPRLAEQAKAACRFGIDALIVRDPGVLLTVRRAVPDVPVFAGAQMSIHNLEGVKMCAAMGFKRVVLAPELSRKKIAYICGHAPIEVAVSVHGNLCMGYSGQCYLGAMTGGRSANRGICEQPCRRSYDASGHAVTHPLSLKDNCLVRYISDLDKIGVACVEIEGEGKRPEYSAIVTNVYSKAAHKGKTPTLDELRVLQTLFSKHGFTDGYYTNRRDQDMLALGEPGGKEDSVIFSTARKNYLNGEFQRVPVRFVGAVGKDRMVKLAAADDRKNTAVIYGPVPEPAFHRELTMTALQTQLHKMSGTPFICAGVKGSVEPGLSLPASVFGEMRRKLLSEILEQRRAVKERREGEYIPSVRNPGRSGPPLLTLSVMHQRQLSEAMAELSPAVVYVPITELSSVTKLLRSFLSNTSINVAAALPRIIHDSERKKISELMGRALDLGITDALVGNIGHIQFARGHGMRVRGDIGLNAFNSETLKAFKNLGLTSAALSVELRASEIRDISKPLDTEIITYGRLPLMITETCLVKNCTGACTCDSFSGITDSSGALYPVVTEYGCRNLLLNSKKLFMSDRRRTTATLGVWAERLMFTTENAHECVEILKRYMGLSDYTPSGYTRGLYYRGTV